MRNSSMRLRTTILYVLAIFGLVGIPNPTYCEDSIEVPSDLPDWIRNSKPLPQAFPLPNVVPPLLDEDDPRSQSTHSSLEPFSDVSFPEHIRRELSPEDEVSASALLAQKRERALIAEIRVPGDATSARVWKVEGKTLFSRSSEGSEWKEHEEYGVGGPLSNSINALAADSRGNLWVGTPLGLSVLDQEGSWNHIRGGDGLPVENITALAIDAQDRLWIGTDCGAIHYRPFESGRQWFYRAGGRYLRNDQVTAIAIAEEGMPVYFETAEGISCLDEIQHTLAEKADRIESRLNRFHRRLGLVVQCVLDDPLNPTMAWTLDDANDGLWTSWHVTAMSLAFAVTGKDEHRESARESMHAIYRLQNHTDVPGLPARSVVSNVVGAARREAAKDARNLHRREEWRPSPSGEYYWCTDTSNDEIDGHYLAMYAYWRHIAQKDPEELALIRDQVRTLTDYIIQNDYRLHDWDGEPTKWGTWNPDDLNKDPRHYLENGLNSLQLLSLLKTTYAITGDEKYQNHYAKLILDHGYLANLLLEKKVFPDMKNHSDDQLGYVAWYPLLQLEWDPAIRGAFQQAVRRHYKIIESGRGSFFYYVSATVDPGYVDLPLAAENLRQIPTDRRMWRVTNSHRADVHFEPFVNRFGRPILEAVLPADERSWDKWNGDPHVPDGGGAGRKSPSGATKEGVQLPDSIEYPDGALEDDGGSWLMAYWLGRYHGFISTPENP